MISIGSPDIVILRRPTTYVKDMLFTCIRLTLPIPKLQKSTVINVMDIHKRVETYQQILYLNKGHLSPDVSVFVHRAFL